MRMHRPLPRTRWQAGGWQEGSRALPDEVPVALSYDGTTQAVMMATPADLEDFALGFSLTEGIARPEEIAEVVVAPQERGIDVQISLAGSATDRLAGRRRKMAGPVGCGLCGIDSIEAALGMVRPVPTSALRLTPAEVCRAMALLPHGQTLHEATRAAHAAAFFRADRGLVTLREDVGRHNALDKLAGFLARTGQDTGAGAVLLTSRVSIDLVQKTAAMGAPILIAASAPTAHAVQMAEAAGITLIGLARGDGFDCFTHPGRLASGNSGEAAHVA
jgi:FdhD protein